MTAPNQLYQQQVRIFYPLQQGKITLRTEQDWKIDIEPVSVDDNGQALTFNVESELPFLYCKPCLLLDGEVRWAAGENYLVIMTQPGISEIHPFFWAPETGSFPPLIEFDSAIMGRKHRLRVYLPAGYAENTLDRYPVLYMQDGKNLFFPDEAFAGSEWHVDEILAMMDAMNAIDEMIVVGIYAEDRMMEYTKPGYETYGRSVVEEVIPLIDAQYRTLTGPQNTHVMGSSLGGVVSFFMAWQWPKVFGRAACLSSTFTFRDDLIERVLSEPKRDVRFYVDSGWPGDNYEATLSMAMALVERGYVYGRDLVHFVFPMASHSEAAWADRLHLPIQMFSGKVRQASRSKLGWRSITDGPPAAGQP